jgi:AcrR family transcriptional regulator
MEDRRQHIIIAGLDILREEGLPSFTQPRIAARAGLRQSHLTYYYPTRTALLAAVARAAIEIQLAAAKLMVEGISTTKQAASAIAAVTSRHENTRVLVALNQAADREPELRELFNELTDGFVANLQALLAKLGMAPNQTSVDVLHALFVGLSVIDLATSRADRASRSRAALDIMFSLLSSQEPSSVRKRGSRRSGE